MPVRPASCLVFSICLLASCIALAQVPYGPNDWPQWRGPNADGVSLDKGLLRQWPAEGPKVVWKVDTVGVGYSSMVIKDGVLFTQGDLYGVEHVIALRVVDGQIVWAVVPEPVARRIDLRVSDAMRDLDKNHNGQIDEDEALAQNGWDYNKSDLPLPGLADPKTVEPQTIERHTAERAARLFQAIDKDHNDRLSFAEAGKLLREYFERIDQADPLADAAELASQRAASYLASLDRNQDASISREEVRGTALERPFGRIDQLLPDSDKGDGELSEGEIAVYLAKSETGKDGEIAVAELQEYYVKNKHYGDGVWSPLEARSFYGGYRNGQGDGPRGTPTVDGDRLYAEGAMGDLTCFEVATGRTIWHVSLPKQLGGGTPGWGYSESPLVVGDLVIVTPGGKQGTLAALDKHTGRTVWQSGEVAEGAHYSSPLVTEIGGIRQVVQFARESVFGVALENGKLLWKYTAANNGTANCCTPIVHDDLVFASSGYGTGGGLAKIVTSGSQQTAEQVYFEKKMACHHGGVVKLGDYLYSNAGGPLLCMNFRTGEIAWQSRSVGKGSLVAADGLLFLLSENHQVALIEADPKECRELAKFSIESHGKPSWAHPIVVGGRLYLRDQQSLTSYDVRGGK